MATREWIRRGWIALTLCLVLGAFVAACSKSGEGKDSSISISESDGKDDGTDLSVVPDGTTDEDAVPDSSIAEDGANEDSAVVDTLSEDGTEPLDTEPGDTEPGDTEPGDTEPSDATTDEDSGSQSEHDGVADPLDLLSDPPTAGVIYIYVTGDLTPQDFKDKLAGQTPTDYVIAVSRYSILTTADDPAPFLCFDHGQTPAKADMHKDNLVGFCSTVSVPTATYTHGRVKVDYVRYTVQGNLHYGTAVFPGSFTFFRAYSKGKYDGIDYLPGQGYITFKGVTEYTTPFYFPEPPVVPNVKTELTNGEYLMTFPFTNPLPIVQNGTELHWARFHWKIHEAFRWKDAGTPTYVKDVWDANSVMTLAEEVLLYGASGYYVTSSVD